MSVCMWKSTEQQHEFYDKIPASRKDVSLVLGAEQGGHMGISSAVETTGKEAF